MQTMLSSIGSLRRSKSTSTVISRRTATEKHPLVFNQNLTPKSQHHAQIAASTAYERSLGIDHTAAGETPLRIRRSTIAEGVPSRLHHRNSSYNLVSTATSLSPYTPLSNPNRPRDSLDLMPSERPLPPAPGEITRSRSSHGLARTRGRKPLMETSVSMDTLPEYSRGLHRANSRRSVSTIREASSAQPFAPPMPLRAPPPSPAAPAQSPAVGRSRSIRRTLRTEEPGRSIPQTHKSRLNLPGSESNVERARSPLSRAQVRKARSMYIWSSTMDPSTQASYDSHGPSSSPFVSRQAASPAPIASNLRHSESIETPLHVRTGEGGVIQNTARKVKHRASLIFTPFRKRDTSSSSKVSTSATPCKSNAYPTSHVRVDKALAVSPIGESQAGSRNISGSSSKKSAAIRSKFARYFRKPSASSSIVQTASAANGGLPLQYIDAVNRGLASPETQHDLFTGPPIDLVPEVIHADVSTIGERELRASMTVADPFGAVNHRKSYLIQNHAEQLAIPPKRHPETRAISPTVTVDTGTSQSRVTSWADSSVTGENDRLSVIAEDAFSPEKLGAYLIGSSKARDNRERENFAKPSGSMGSSFLRRLVKRSSMNGYKEYETQADELGRQKRRVSLVDSLSSWRNRQTVRVVPNELAAVDGPDHESRPDSAASLPTDGDYPISPAVRRKPVPCSRAHSLQVANVSPSADVRAERFAKANNRWATPLNESQGLFFPRSPLSSSRGTKRRASIETESRSAVQEKGKAKATPHISGEAFKIDRSAGVMSPSVYSQASGFGSSPLWRDGNGTVTIMESRSYPTESPTKKRESIATNGNPPVDWTVWLNKEVAELGEGITEMSFEGFTENAITSTPPRHQRESAMINEPDETMILEKQDDHIETIAALEDIVNEAIEDSIAIDMTPAAILATACSLTPKDTTASPRPIDTRRSSRVMNERFPMVDTGGPSSSPTSSIRPSSQSRAGTTETRTNASGSSSGLSTPETPTDKRASLLRARGRRKSRLGPNSDSCDEQTIIVGQSRKGKENSIANHHTNSRGRAVFQNQSNSETGSPLHNKEITAHSSCALPLAPYTTTEAPRPPLTTAERRMQSVFGKASNQFPVHSMNTLASFHTARESPWNKSEGSEDRARAEYETPSPTPGRNQDYNQDDPDILGFNVQGFRSSPVRQSSEAEGPAYPVESESLLAQTKGPSMYSIASDQTLMDFLRISYREMLPVSNSATSLALSPNVTARNHVATTIKVEPSPSAKHHTSRLPVPASGAYETSPSRLLQSRLLSDKKENSPRHSPASAGTPVQHVQSRLTRAVTGLPAASLNDNRNSSPLRPTSVKSQTSGQKLAEKWLNEKSAQSSPVANEKTEISGVTQMFL